MMYVLDSNVFIQAKNFHYGIDFCPAFWNWLVDKNRADVVCSIRAVLDELGAQEDELATWARERNKGFFRDPDEEHLSALGRVSRWAYETPRYEPSAVNAF